MSSLVLSSVLFLLLLTTTVAITPKPTNRINGDQLRAFIQQIMPCLHLPGLAVGSLLVFGVFFACVLHSHSLLCTYLTPLRARQHKQVLYKTEK